MNVGTLRAILGLDTSEFDRGIEGAKRSVGGLGATLKQAASGMLGSLNDFGSRINSTIVTGLKAGLVAGLGAIGATIAAGFGRLRAIDDAQAKLRGLGHDAGAVDTIMSNALASVKGTAFGLGDAATIAASAVASGIKPGEALERTLKLTADAAAIAGVSLSDMGLIFGNVAASNRLSMQEVNMLAQRGVPIMQWLAAEYGVTAQEARKMVEQGEVDFATFQKVIEDNIGGAALAMGESWSGAFSNMLAAAGRFGAALIGPIFDQMKGWFTGLTGMLDAATERITPFAEAMGARIANAVAAAGQAVGNFVAGLRGGFTDGLTGGATAAERFGQVVGDAVRAVVDRVRDLVEWGREHEDTIRRVGAAIGVAVPIVFGLASATNAIVVAWRVLTAATPIGIILALVTALTYAWQNSETFRNVVTGAFEAVKGVVGPVIEAVVGWLSTLTANTSGVASTWSSTWQQVMDSTATTRATLGTIFGQIWELIRLTVDDIRGKIEAFVSVAQALWARWGDTITAYARTTWNNITALVNAALLFIQGVLNVVLGVITGDWSRAWEGIRNILSSAWQAMGALVGQALNVLATAISVALAGISQRWAAAWQAVRDFLSSTWDAMQARIQQGLAVAQQLLSVSLAAISNLWNTVWTAVSTFLSSTWDAMQARIQAGTDLVRAIITAALTAIQAFWQATWTAISTFLSNTWQAMQTRVQQGVDAVRTLIQTALAAISAAWSTSWAAISTLLSNTWTAIQTRVQQGVSAVQSAISAALSAIQSAWSSAWSAVQSTLSSAWTQIQSAVRSGVDAVVGFFSALPGRIMSAIGGLPGQLFNFGRDAMGQFTAGVRSIDVWGGIRGIFDSLPGFVKSILGINSPSQVFFEIGRNIAQGLINGIRRQEANIRATAQRMADAAAINVGGGVAGGGPALQKVLSILGRFPGARITSTYRTPEQNRRVGGAPNSYHMDRANPAVDIGGPTTVLDRLAPALRALGGWREFLWRVKGHYDHIHVAHKGGRVTPAGIVPLRHDELLAKLQIGETVLPAGAGGQRGSGDGADLLGVLRSIDAKLDKQRVMHATLDLGEGIQRRVTLTLDDRDRAFGRNLRMAARQRVRG